MTMLGIAAGVAVAFFVAAAVFQVALAAGAAWGRAAYGGSHEGQLPRRLRISSAVSSMILVAAALVVARRAGAESWAPLSDAALPVTTWVLVAFLALSLLLNTITPSSLERAIWAPTSAVALAATTAVNLLAP